MRLNWLAVFLVVAFIGLAGLWQVYRWDECRQVGHSKFYCVMTAGK